MIGHICCKQWPPRVGRTSNSLQDSCLFSFTNLKQFTSVIIAGHKPHCLRYAHVGIVDIAQQSLPQLYFLLCQNGFYIHTHRCLQLFLFLRCFSAHATHCFIFSVLLRAHWAMLSSFKFVFMAPFNTSRRHCFILCGCPVVTVWPRTPQENGKHPKFQLSGLSPPLLHHWWDWTIAS